MWWPDAPRGSRSPLQVVCVWLKRIGTRLSNLGQELICLLPGRDAKAAARNVALAIRSPVFKAAYLMTSSASGEIIPMEVLWQDDAPMATVTVTP